MPGSLLKTGQVPRVQREVSMLGPNKSRAARDRDRGGRKGKEESILQKASHDLGQVTVS